MTRTAPAPARRPAAIRQFRVVTPIEKHDEDGKVTGTYWQRLGRAFENEGRDGRGASITLLLNALPMSNRLMLFEDDGKGDEAGREDDGR
jgi:hypothetical protein